MLKKKTRFVARCGMLLTVLLGLSVGMEAQSEGNNAITSNTTGTIAASTAYIDASPFFANTNQGNSDICKTSKGILTSAFGSYPSAGAVVDGGLAHLCTSTTEAAAPFAVSKGAHHERFEWGF